ncbi:unnamed protein product [Boreogadus saida]
MALNEMSSQHEARLSDLDNRASGTSQLLAPCSVKCHTPGVSEGFERRRSTVQLIAVSRCVGQIPCMLLSDALLKRGPARLTRWDH